MLTFYISMLETEEQQDKFSYIYQNYVGFMYHVAKEVVKEHYLAEDVVHETFLQLIRIIDKVHIDDELTLRAFLRRVTHNKAVDCVRKWDKVRPTEDDELERYDTKHKQDPETIAIDALAFNELIAMISKMDDRYRAPLELKLQGYQVKEIATILNITPENTKVRIFRARRMILDKLESYHEKERERRNPHYARCTDFIGCDGGRRARTGFHAESERNECSVSSFRTVSEENGPTLKKGAPKRGMGPNLEAYQEGVDSFYQRYDCTDICPPSCSSISRCRSGYLDPMARWFYEHRLFPRNRSTTFRYCFEN